MEHPAPRLGDAASLARIKALAATPDDTIPEMSDGQATVVLDLLFNTEDKPRVRFAGASS